MRIHTSKRHPKTSTFAWTIVEIVIASSLMSVMAVSLFGGISSAFSLTQLAREDLRATQIMTERMETIRLYSWSQINGSNNFVIPKNFTETYYPQGMGSAVGITYTGLLSIAPLSLGSAVYSNAMRSVNVSVTWKSGKALRTRSISTYVGSNGIQNYVYN